MGHEENSVSSTGSVQVNYAESARRHFHDAGVLRGYGRQANAGQLFGIAAECGIKAVLVACKVPVDTQGSIDGIPGTKGKGFRDHWPQLGQALVDLAGFIPDSRMATGYLSLMPNLTHFSNWLIAHRYWCDAALPLTSLEAWNAAAAEVMAALDRAQEDGSL